MTEKAPVNASGIDGGFFIRAYEHRVRTPQAIPILPPAASLAFARRWREVRSGSASAGMGFSMPKSQR